jgi:hypothetical protein
VTQEFSQIVFGVSDSQFFRRVWGNHVSIRSLHSGVGAPSAPNVQYNYAWWVDEDPEATPGALYAIEGGGVTTEELALSGYMLGEQLADDVQPGERLVVVPYETCDLWRIQIVCGESTAGHDSGNHYVVSLTNVTDGLELFSTNPETWSGGLVSAIGGGVMSPDTYWPLYPDQNNTGLTSDKVLAFEFSKVGSPSTGTSITTVTAIVQFRRSNIGASVL